jgi:hypothetical protein
MKIIQFCLCGVPKVLQFVSYCEMMEGELPESDET